MAIDDQDSTPRWLRHDKPIEVDLATLGQFAKALQDEIDNNFTPHMDFIINSLDPGADAFQRKPDFPEINAAYYTYNDSRYQAMALLNAYRLATGDLAKAADLIAQQYAGTDAFAAARTADVQKAFADADRLEWVIK